MRPLSTLQLCTIFSLGILSGSRAYGGWHEKSDYDYLLMIQDYVKLDIQDDQIDRYSTGSWDGNEDHLSYICTDEIGDKINLIVFNSRVTFDLWVNATSVLAELYNNPIICMGLHNKRLRLDLFRALRFALFSDDSGLTRKCKTVEDLPEIFKSFK